MKTNRAAGLGVDQRELVGHESPGEKAHRGGRVDRRSARDSYAFIAARRAPATPGVDGERVSVRGSLDPDRARFGRDTVGLDGDDVGADGQIDDALGRQRDRGAPVGGDRGALDVGGDLQRRVRAGRDLANDAGNQRLDIGRRGLRIGRHLEPEDRELAGDGAGFGRCATAHPARDAPEQNARGDGATPRSEKAGD